MTLPGSWPLGFGITRGRSARGLRNRSSEIPKEGGTWILPTRIFPLSAVKQSSFHLRIAQTLSEWLGTHDAKSTICYLRVDRDTIIACLAKQVWAAEAVRKKVPLS